MLIEKLLISWTFTFILTYGFDNLSANKPTDQYRQTYTCRSCGAGKAVDGNMSTCMRTDDIGITTAFDSKTWWYVDLGGIYNVYNIRILFRDYPGYTIRQKGRFAGFSLYVSNTTDRHDGYLCYKDGPDLPSLDFNTNCAPNITIGRYVIFYNERLVGIRYPVGYETTSVYTELCEVTVIGCVRLNVYGNNCDRNCTDHCPEPRCYISNGACYSCAPGWMGHFCEKKCSSGYYGLRCMTKCVGHCKDNEPCNHISGTCNNGCLDGWTGANCNKQCSPGKYGPGCLYRCSGHCLNDKACNVTTGKCDDGCKLGYMGDMCDTDCENEKDCEKQCNGHCLYNLPCNSSNGLCSNGCAPGYVGMFCNNTCFLEPMDLTVNRIVLMSALGVYVTM